AEIPVHDRLVALTNGGPDKSGHLYVLPIDDPFRNPETVLVENAGSGIYDPDLDVLFVFGNDGKVVQPIRGGDMQQTDRIPVLQPALADYGHYDGRRHEGIMCGVAGPISAVMNGGRSYFATALHG